MTTIFRALPGDRPALTALLDGLNLPTSGLDDTDLWFASEGADMSGVAGLEIHGEVGLLRSVAVPLEARSRGIAGTLVQHVTAQAQEHGLSDLYLLTTTAAMTR